MTAGPAVGTVSSPVAVWRRRLDVWQPGHTVLVLDLDGTLHRGRFGWARGLSSVDLAWELGWMRRVAGLPIPPPRFSARVARFWRMERRARAAHGDGREYFRAALEGFRGQVLRGVDAEDLRTAAARAARFAHPDLAPALRRIAPVAGRVLVLSKAFDPMVDAYVALVCAATARPTSGEGNPVAPDRSLRFVAGADKGAGLAAWLARRPELTAALVVGDTAQDLAVRDAAIARLGLQHVVCAALRPKDETLGEAADVTAATWTELAELLVGPEEDDMASGAGSGSSEVAVVAEGKGAGGAI